MRIYIEYQLFNTLQLLLMEHVWRNTKQQKGTYLIALNDSCETYYKCIFHQCCKYSILIARILTFFYISS